MRDLKTIEPYGLVKVYANAYDSNNAGKVIEAAKYLLVITKDMIHQTLLCMYPNGFCKWTSILDIQETSSGYIAPRTKQWYSYLPILNAFYVAYDNGKNAILVDMINRLAPDVAVRFKNRHATYIEYKSREPWNKECSTVVQDTYAKVAEQKAIPTTPQQKLSCHNRDTIIQTLLDLQETLDTCKVTIDTLLKLV